MDLSRIIVMGMTFGALTLPARAGPVLTFTDLDEFLAAAGDVHEIDFETLPDGSPSYFGVEITREFNYTDQGVEFASQIPVLQISMLGGGDFILTTVNPTTYRNWIIADFVIPAWAVGIVLPGGTTLSAFDEDGQLIGSIFGGGPGGGHFLGIVSDVPMALATGDRGSSSDSWQSFFFTPIPEPATLLLVVGGAVAVMRRQRPGWPMSFGHGGDDDVRSVSQPIWPAERTPQQRSWYPPLSSCPPPPNEVGQCA